MAAAITPIGVAAALRIMGSGEATVRQLAQRLRCGRCGNHRVGIVLRSDPRPDWIRERDGPALETQAGPSSGTAQPRPG
jgi:hypothetical protein